MSNETPTLTEQTKAIQKALRDTRVGPLRVAKQVVSILDNWEPWRKEADGEDGASWARVAFGTKAAPSYYRRRMVAVASMVSLGFSRDFAVSEFHHDVLVYMMGAAIPSDRRKEVVNAVKQEQVRRKDNVLSVALARRVVSDVLSAVNRTTKPAKKKTPAKHQSLAALDPRAERMTRWRTAPMTKTE